MYNAFPRYTVLIFVWDTTLQQLVELIPKTEEGPQEGHNRQEPPGEHGSPLFSHRPFTNLSFPNIAAATKSITTIALFGGPLRKVGIMALPPNLRLSEARHAKVLLASGEEGASDCELAASLSSFRKDNMEEKMVNLAMNVLKEAKEKPEAVHADPWLS